jgi:hypothetical protein
MKRRDALEMTSAPSNCAEAYWPLCENSRFQNAILVGRSSEHKQEQVNKKSRGIVAVKDVRCLLAEFLGEWM